MNTLPTILAIESSTESIGIAVGNSTECYSQLVVQTKRDMAKDIIPLTREVLRYAQLELSQVTHLAVNRGPGFFTSLRIGISYVRSMAQALHLPIVTTDSFHLMVHPYQSTQALRDPIAIIIDGKKDRYFFNIFENNRMKYDGMDIFPSEVVEQIQNYPQIYAIGSGIEPLKPAIASLWDHQIFEMGANKRTPNPIDLLAIAAKAVQGNQGLHYMHYNEVKPFYCRRSEAEENFRAKGLIDY